jgi:hypothetical protein
VAGGRPLANLCEGRVALTRAAASAKPKFTDLFPFDQSASRPNQCRSMDFVTDKFNPLYPVRNQQKSDFLSRDRPIFCLQRFSRISQPFGCLAGFHLYAQCLRNLPGGFDG